MKKRHGDGIVESVLGVIESAVMPGFGSGAAP
jgi:hypothetical protein